MNKPQTKSTGENSKIMIGIIMSLTLGLAPFTPEPHIIGKIQWLMGGANGMELKDYFDLALHGTPWLFLIYALIDRSRSMIM
jgi:hypothetical protein